ncbi:MAG: CHRD domain-containing protein [Nitrososphaera sp.]|nr:CHRD domain-containing protein [Nitrososphaera sp.]
MKKSSVIVMGAIVVAGILAFSLLATAAQQMLTATATNAKVLTIETVPLEGLSLDEGEFLLLADTTPAEIGSGHVALSIPCEGEQESPETDIDLLAGVAPDLNVVELDYVSDLSDPSQNRCTFHMTIPEADEQITDVAIINNVGTVQFESGHFATISLTTAEDKKVDEAGVEGVAGARTFSASLTGGEEVPEVDTNASGNAELIFDEDADEFAFVIDVQDIVDVNAAHIHTGAAGEEGDIVATLFDDSIVGEFGGELASNNITSSDLEGPLSGENLDSLIALIENGEAYVNVHTDTFPDGEIRGQLEED